MEKFGKGYVSGKSLDAQEKAPDSEGDLRHPESIVPSELRVSLRKFDLEYKSCDKKEETDEIYCAICSGYYLNGLVGIGEQVQKNTKEIDWVYCDICGYWNHADCLGIDIGEIVEESPWFCPEWS